MPSEAELIAAGDGPVTANALVGDLRALGLGPGETVMVHSSLSALGWVPGGPQAVVEALIAAVEPGGTIVMPAQSGGLTDPASWSDPPLPASWIDAARDALPAYDTHLTPTRGMGAVVECFRTHPAAMRSAHPTLSVAALGPAAAAIVEPHPLTPALGDGSPLGRLYDLDALVLLLGVDHTSNTTLHLAEYRATWPGKRTSEHGAPVLVDGVRRWIVYEDLDLDESDFGRLGDDFAAAGEERTGPVGAASARLGRARALVDFAVAWLSTHRR